MFLFPVLKGMLTFCAASFTMQLGCLFSQVHLSYKSQDQLSQPHVNVSGVESLPSFMEVILG